jgi:hypothetical protein
VPADPTTGLAVATKTYVDTADALKQAASALLTSIAALATDGIMVKTGAVASTYSVANLAAFLAGTSNAMVDANIARTAGALYTLPSTGSMGVNGNNGISFYVPTATSTVTFDNPTNIPQGRSGVIWIDSTGSDVTLAFGTNWYFATSRPTKRTASKHGLISYIAVGANVLFCQYTEDFVNV